MPDEYISREAAIKEVYRFDGYLDDDLEWRLHYALKKLPAADVVEVVRCRECIFGNMPCAMARYPDYFCADGKRKDGVKDE